MLQDLIIPFITVGLAELGDKTQLAIFLLASKTKKHIQLLLGIILAFIIADGLAILLGDFLTTIVPMDIIKITAGIIFIIFGMIILVNNKKEKKENYTIKTPFITGFTLILLSEMGDKTQIASGLFATKFDPLLVFVGIIASLTILSIMALYLGKFITKKINKKTISMIAGILFIAIGIASFF